MNEWIPSGVLVSTVDGGTLGWEPRSYADDPNSYMDQLVCVASVEPVARHDAQDTAVLKLTIAATDADGQMWQRSRIISVFDLWELALAEPLLTPHYADPATDPQLRNAQHVERRWLIRDMETLADDRDICFAGVYRLRADQGPGDRGEFWCFALKMKYFGAEFGLVEQTIMYRPPPARPASAPPPKPMTSVHLVVNIQVDAESFPGKDGKTISLAKAGVNGPVFESRPIRIRDSWLVNCVGPAQRADRAAWIEVLRNAGLAQPETLAALQANRAFRYRQGK